MRVYTRCINDVRRGNQKQTMVHLGGSSGFFRQLNRARIKGDEEEGGGRKKTRQFTVESGQAATRRSGYTKGERETTRNNAVVEKKPEVEEEENIVSRCWNKRVSARKFLPP